MSARRRRAIIHIGTPKTGSTSIQAMLAGNRAALLGQGFAYPLSPGERTHLRLALFATEEAEATRMASAGRVAGSPAFLRERLAAELGAEIAALPPGVHTVVFSNEHLANKVGSAEAARRLRALLEPWFEEIRILVYLRRQDECAVSHYSTLLRAGFTMPEVLPDLSRAQWLDWAALLDRWAGAFGPAALMPRIFDPAGFVGGDLLADARAALGLGPLALAPEAAVMNPSLSPAAQEFLRRLNLAARPAGAPDAAEAAIEEEAEGLDDLRRDGEPPGAKVPAFIRGLLDQRFAGPGRRPSRAEAMAFVGHFAAGNERVRAAYFPARATLFPTDFSRYPDQADPPPPAEALLEVAIAVVTAESAQHAADMADLLARLGRERLAQAPAEARQFLRRALLRQPAHLGALRGLVELAGDPAVRDEAESLLRRALALEPERPELRVLQQRLQRLSGRAAPGPGPEAGAKPLARPAPPAPTPRAAGAPRAEAPRPAAGAPRAEAPRPAEGAPRAEAPRPSAASQADPPRPSAASQADPPHPGAGAPQAEAQEAARRARQEERRRRQEARAARRPG